MARIKGKDTAPERMLVQAMQAINLHFEEYPHIGKVRPDFSLPDIPAAVFLDGCFWHGCPDHYVRPRTREDFWAKKLAGNVERDRRQTAALEAAGWRVLRFWECEVREDPTRVAEDIRLAMIPVAAERSHRWVVERVEVLDPTTDLERRCLVDLRDATAKIMQDRVRSTRKKGKR